MSSYRGLPDPLPIVPLGFALDAEVLVPGSKSLTNRALLVAAVASGPTLLTGVLASDDTEAMLNVLRATGVAVDHDTTMSTAIVHGTGSARRVEGSGATGCSELPTRSRRCAPALRASTSCTSTSSARRHR